ncbi:MAG: thioredoxin domain-containing protein [Candidatus Gastranaerophilales bacterium]|nr:thioredoxin domain-containing protein [Candidatus Gastranaerophilales bacterium]
MIFNSRLFFTAGLIIFVFAVFVMLNAKAVPPRANLLPSDYSTGITYNQAVKMKKPIVINFYVDWCHYCREFAPSLDSLRRQYGSKMNFVYVNVEKPDGDKLVKEFPISGYPSLYLYAPKSGNRTFVNQSIYSDKKLLKVEFDRFLKFNK